MVLAYLTSELLLVLNKLTFDPLIDIILEIAVGLSQLNFGGHNVCSLNLFTICCRYIFWAPYYFHGHLRGNLFSSYARFSKKLTFVTLWYAHVRRWSFTISLRTLWFSWIHDYIWLHIVTLPYVQGDGVEIFENLRRGDQTFLVEMARGNPYREIIRRG